MIDTYLADFGFSLIFLEEDETCATQRIDWSALRPDADAAPPAPPVFANPDFGVDDFDASIPF